MSNSEIRHSGNEDRLELSASIKIICKNQNVTSHNSKPSKRYGHLSFVYKGKLYVQGGYSNQGKSHTPANSDNKSNIYCINFQKQRSASNDDKKYKKTVQTSEGKWEVVQARFTPAAETQFEIFAYQAYCIFPHKKRLYMFGGSTVEGKTSNNLFRLDLDSLEWSKPQQKGTVPKAREDASLSLYTKNQKNYLVLYGGANYETYEVFSDIHFYQIETKYWFQCHNLSSNFIQPRLSPGVCFNQNKIYVFGGYYVDAHHKKGYLNDLYEIQFTLSVEKGRPYGRSFAKRLDAVSAGDQQLSIKPQKRCSCSFTFYKADLIQSLGLLNTKKQNKLANNWLLLIGGEKSCQQKKKISTLNDFWIYSIFQMRWRNVNLAQDFRPRSSFSSVIDKQANKIFIFGGLSTLQLIMNDLMSVRISSKSVVEDLKQKKIVQEQRIPALHLINLQGLIVEEICNDITFPFAAIGLIVDNFVNFQAEFCDITYHVSKSKPVYQNYIKFESNANFVMNNETILSSFCCLKGGIRTYIAGTDKKIKAEMYKDNLSKQIGTNFVLGSLRIGNQVIFLNLDQETFQIQIIVVLKCKQLQMGNKQGISQNQNELKSFKLFSFLIAREEIVCEQTFSYHKNTDQSKRRRFFFQKICPEQSKERLKMLISQGINTIKKGEVKNVLYISKLRTVEGQECTVNTTEAMLQIFPDMLRNDFIYGDRDLLHQIQASKIPVYQSLDVSLKAYISYLYVHCDTQLTVSIHALQKKPIYVQEYILKIDELLKNKEINEISSQFEFDCKIIELYHFSDKQQMNTSSKIILQFSDKFFANGTLYYHKARLVKRHGINLGDYCLQYKLMSIQQEGIPGQKPIILRNANNYGISEVFGHIELPQAVPINSTKTDFIFPVMLQKIYQKLRNMENEVERLRLNQKGSKVISRKN